MADAVKKTSIVRSLPKELVEKLRAALEAHAWEMESAPYAFFKAKKEKTNVVAYESGKLVIQGAGSEDFVEFILDPEVMENIAFQEKAEENFLPHAGMDESGKGDYFGPLVACAAFVPDAATAQRLADAGVRDCKLIKNDKALLAIAAEAVKILEGKIGFVSIGPSAYNRMYASFRSVNPLLAWAHARALENLLEKVPFCTEALADKFGNESLILNALQEKGRKIRLIQRTKAESDMAVACASVIARAGFLKGLSKLSAEAGITLPKGAGEEVDLRAGELAQKGGRELLSSFAKMHFRTTCKALGLPVPEKTEWKHC